jgi:hypothetical protein
MLQVPTPGPTTVPTVRPTSRPSLVSALMPLSKEYKSMQRCIVPVYVHEIERLTGALDEDAQAPSTAPTLLPSTRPSESPSSMPTVLPTQVRRQ